MSKKNYRGAIIATHPELVKLVKNEYLDTNDVCVILQVSPRTVQAMRSKLILPYSKTGKSILYPVQEVKDLIKRHMKYRREKGEE